MTEELSLDRVVGLLSDALEQLQLPAKANRVGKRLLSRLNSPVRVTIMGPSNPGRRAVVNALAERAIIPDDGKLPTYEICSGDADLLRVTGRDGAKTDLQGHDFLSLKGMKPSFVQIFALDPFPKTITLLDIVTNGSSGQQLAAAKWASKRTDIAIWVTADFSPDEKKLWQRMPDAMHNHCFLVPVHDKPAQNGTDPQRLSNDSGRDLFLGVYPIVIDETADVSAAQNIGALSTELKRCVDTGLQADVDQALVFLNRFASELVPSPEKRKAGRPDTGTDEDIPTLESLSLVSDSGGFSGAREDIREQQSAALRLIETDAQAMLDSLGEDEDAATKAITARCAQTAQQLCDLTTIENPLHDATFQAADYLVLLELENEDDNPDDAVTALLQMKRMIECELAA